MAISSIKTKAISSKPLVGNTAFSRDVEYLIVGGGGGGGTSGGGGSGVVILKFVDTASDPTISGGLTYAKTTVTGYKIFSFTAGTGTVNW